MKKEDVLEKSRESGEDEGNENAVNKGLSWGLLALTITFAFISVFCLVFSRDNLTPSYAASTMLWAFLSAHCIPQYRFTRKKAMLIGAIGYGVACITSLLSLIITLVK